jgi:hypothetical protein
VVGRELLTLCPHGEDHQGRKIRGDIWRGRRTMFIDFKSSIATTKRMVFHSVMGPTSFRTGSNCTIRMTFISTTWTSEHGSGVLRRWRDPYMMLGTICKKRTRAIMTMRGNLSLVLNMRSCFLAESLTRSG